METIKLLIFTHGMFGKELINSTSMIVGKIEDIYSFSLMPGVSIEQYYSDVKSTVETLDGQLLAICDLYGGTPNHVAMMLGAQYDMPIICGLNMAMLLEAVLKRDSIGVSEDLARCAIEAGEKSIQMNERIQIDE